ncbi:hypothetical protein CHS0354_027483 [Potamilus streckersoni]|uniref:Galaxin-like repeats domain-containing protein n=1 Tax=Potamilus streckersoni TaxID=2493646 RepID=A0AAE0VQE7_9BIVA|nr:hypothetical protein CHS0354_027483 [Potamilus streckersoni]
MHLQKVCMILSFYWSLLNVYAELFVFNNELVNTSTHIYCGGKAIPLWDQYNRRQSCCMSVQSTKGGEPYSEDTYFCCDVIRLKHDGDGNEWHCCDKNKPYRKDKHICCGVHLKSLNNSDDKNECCDGKFYNFKSQVCCRNTLYQRKENQIDENYMECCGDARYDSRNLRCEHSSESNPKLLSIDLGICNRQEYNMTTHICCDEKVIQFPDLHESQSYSCCGGKLFKTTHMKCCSDSHLIPKSRECCGNDSYDPYHQRCCSGVPNKVSSLLEKSKCCGTKLIQKHDVCCNGIHGDLNFQCCNDKLINKKEICCEGRALEPSKICCVGRNGATKQIEKGKVSDNACCTYRKHHLQIYQPYDQMNQICFKGVFEKTVVPNKPKTVLSSTTKIPTSEKLKMDDVQANINFACSRKMTAIPLVMILVLYHLLVSA